MKVWVLLEEDEEEHFSRVTVYESPEAAKAALNEIAQSWTSEYEDADADPKDHVAYTGNLILVWRGTREEGWSNRYEIQEHEVRGKALHHPI